jgi:hypothetical protein
MQTDRYPTVLHTEEDQLLLEKGKENTTAIQLQISGRRREERREEERAEETRCKRMPRRLATSVRRSVRRRRFRALDSNERRKKGTNERTKHGSFYTSIGVGIQKGLLSWLAATVTDEREKRTCREGKQTAWMDGWMTLEIGRS